MLDAVSNQQQLSQRDPALLSAVWGIAWGVALGLWWLAPKVIETHRIRPDGTLQWLVVIGGLTAISALIGSYLSFLGSFALAVVEKALLGTFRDRNWAYGLFSGVLVVVTYTLQSFFIYWTSFRSLDLTNYLGHITTVAAFCLISSGICAVLYRQITAMAPRPRASLLGWILVVVSLSGAFFNLWSASSASLPEPNHGALERLAPISADPPLLFIGLDGGTWRVLDRAIHDGSAPTLRNLVARGRTGTVQALWPPHWSGAAWASIVTGLPREVTGVYEDLAAIGPGLPIMQVPLDPDPRLNPFYVVRAGLRASRLIRYMPPPRALLRGKPVWQLLHEAGVDTAVVHFRFTYPPHGQGDVVVSDWVRKGSVGEPWRATPGGARHRDTCEPCRRTAATFFVRRTLRSRAVRSVIAGNCATKAG